MMDLDLSFGANVEDPSGDIDPGIYPMRVHDVSVENTNEPKPNTSGKYIKWDSIIDESYPKFGSWHGWINTPIPLGPSDPRWASLSEEEREKEGKKARMLARHFSMLTGVPVEQFMEGTVKVNLPDLIGKKHMGLFATKMYEGEKQSYLKKILPFDENASTGTNGSPFGGAVASPAAALSGPAPSNTPF